MEFTGEFEAHVTVRVADSDALGALQRWADERGLKFHHIVLERGRTPSQPMVSQRASGRLADQVVLVDQLCRYLTEAGFVVSRVKVEAAPTNEGVPQADEEDAQHRGRYFEHHVKLALHPGADLAALAVMAVSHSAHLSRNARRTRSDGVREQFVTQRCHGVGRRTARERLTALLAALATTGHPLISVEEEYVVLDSNPGVDAGWLEPNEVSP